jgi:glycosyltransferase involved in cell wall biosynthesis
MSNRPRLAWFSPLPPVRSGIAAYSAELLPLLADYDVDVFTDQPALPAGLSAYEFQPRHLQRPYDLIVYQLGNASFHDYMWPYLVRYPGLVVLHDAQLHQSRAKLLLQQRRDDDYRAEFAWNHPDARPAVAEYVAVGLGGPVHYFWPMLRVPLAHARLVAVHNARTADELRSQFPETPIETIAMGVPVPGLATRATHGIPDDAVVFAAFGGVTPEKRVPQILRAFAALDRTRPAHLLLVGATAGYYDVAADAAQAGIADRMTVTGYVADEDLPGYLAAADVCLCLRWPTARETSASWLRCLAAGRTTVITDLANLVDVPSLDPRTWTPQCARAWGLHGSPNRRTPVCVSIDILDEDHSLRLALRRLLVDADLRTQLGSAAHAYWQTHHTLEQMAADYRRVIDRARATNVPAPTEAPAHLHEDGTALANQIASTLGVELDP